MDLNLSEILPGEKVYTETNITNVSNGAMLYVGILDTMTGKQCVTLVLNQNKTVKYAILNKNTHDAHNNIEWEVIKNGST